MTSAIAILILIAPFAVAAAVGWAAHRGNVLRFRLDLFEIDQPDYESYRAGRDIDLVRTRFERHPVWPGPGVSGERR